MDIRSKIISLFEENGVHLDLRLNEQDIDLRDYIYDSLHFVSFVVELEEALEIEIADEMLLYENLSSLNGFANMITRSLEDDTLSQLVYNHES